LGGWGGTEGRGDRLHKEGKDQRQEKIQKLTPKDPDEEELTAKKGREASKNVPICARRKFSEKGGGADLTIVTLGVGKKKGTKKARRRHTKKHQRRDGGPGKRRKCHPNKPKKSGKREYLVKDQMSKAATTKNSSVG